MSIRRLLRHLWGYSSNRHRQTGCRRKTTEPVRVRLQLEVLEDRLTPSNTTVGTVSGVVVVTNNTPLQGIEVTLTGVSDQGNPVALNTITDAGGSYTLRNVPVGSSYQLAAQPGPTFIGGTIICGLSVAAGQNTSQSLGVSGLAPAFVSMQDFLSTSGPFPFPVAGPVANNAPFVQTAIADINLALGGSQLVDLAAHFADLDMTGSTVRFDTSAGPMDVNLFNSQAPQTVANFLDYVLSGRYDNTIFHRLDTSPPVLQGGAFSLQADPGGGFSFGQVANPNDPTVQNEFNANFPDTLGTISMAKGTDPNSATSSFFFNLADNSSTLGSTNTGGFTVFGAIASDPTSQAVFQALQHTPVQNESATNPAFGTLPLNNYSGSAFPTDTTASNYVVINSAEVIQNDDSLTYSVVSNSNPNLVTAQFVGGHPEVLSLQAGNQTGTTTITVQATDQFGASVQTSFQVNVVPLAITAVTNPVNSANQTNTSASGTTAVGTTVAVTATDGTHTSAAVTATVDGSGHWTATGINVSTLTDGTITYTATATDAAGNTASTTRTATKDTVAPAITITQVTDPINIATDKTNTMASGTTEVGATVSVTATDGTHTTALVAATVVGSNWTAPGIDVSSLTDGTITYTATATDAVGNAATATLTATKDTVAITSVTDPILIANQTNTSASGTTELGASVFVTATDGTHTTTAVTATVDGSGNWTTATGIDVTGLANGTITYTAIAMDLAGNMATATLTATKTV